MPRYLVFFLLDLYFRISVILFGSGRCSGAALAGGSRCARGRSAQADAAAGGGGSGRRLRLRAAAAGAWRRSLGSVCGGQRPSRACACVPGRAARVPSGPARDSPGRGDSTSWSATTQPRWLEPTRSNSLYRPAGRQPSESL